MNNERNISEGSACFLVKDKSLFEGWDSFVYEWLRNEGFVSWGKRVTVQEQIGYILT